MAEARRLASGLSVSPDLAAKSVDPVARQKLVIAQRQERADLLAAQETRRLRELAQRPKGLRKAFLRVTGRYRSNLARCEALANDAAIRDAAERQEMINRHLAARRAIEVALGLKHAAKARSAALKDPSAQDGPSKDALLKDPAKVLDQLTYHKASFTRTDVLRALADKIPDPLALQQATKTALSAPGLVRLSDDRVPRFTTRDFQNAEKQLLTSAGRLAGARGFKVARAHVRNAIAQQNTQMKTSFSGQLSDEQIGAIQHLLGPQQLSQIVGLAGAGKSTMLATANDAWRRQGILVHGAALSGKAAEGLQEASGIPSKTLAALELSWQNGCDPIAKGDVLVIDEAGMLGTRQQLAPKVAHLMGKCLKSFKVAVGFKELGV